MMAASMRMAGRRALSGKSYPRHQLVGLPALSPTMANGIIGEWKVKVGGEIHPGTVLVDIMTDKASVDFDATEDGFMARHLVENGTENVPVGAPICIIVEDQKDVEAFADYQVEAAAAAAPKPVEAAPKPVVAAAPKPAVAAPAPKPVAAATPAPKPVAAATPKPASSSPPSTDRLSPILLAQCLAYESKFGNTFLVPKPPATTATA